MPGKILAVQGTKLVGCAWHPRYRGYEVIVHAVIGSAVVKSALANESFKYGALPPEAAGHGFVFDLASLALRPERVARARVLIGETDEWLDLPGRQRRPDGEITIEEIVELPFRRPWVGGKIYFDAMLAGLSIESVVDLTYRDFLGRPADAPGLAHYAGRLRDGSLDYAGFRAVLLRAPEYAQRKWRTHEAPGAIFSRRIVLSAGREPEAEMRAGRGAETHVPADALLARDGIDFVAASYLRLVGEPPPAGLVWRRLDELRTGRQRLDILRELAQSPHARLRNIRLAGPVDGDAAAAAPRASARKARRGEALSVSAAELLGLDGGEFAEASWQRILGRSPSEEERAFCAVLDGREQKRELLEHLAREPEAVARKVRLAAPAAAGAAARRKRDWEVESAVKDGNGVAIAGLATGPVFDTSGGASDVAALIVPRDAPALAPLFGHRPPPPGWEPFGDSEAIDGAFVGAGFHAAETDGGKNWWRWTGPGRQIQIRLPVAKPGDYRVSIWCERAPPAVLDGLKVRCAGEEAAVNITRRDGSASLLCEARAPEAGFVGWLDLELEHGPPEQAGDGRMLGLCIGSIGLEE